MRSLKWLLVLLALGIVAACVAYYSRIAEAERILETELALARAAGLPTTQSELELNPISDDVNAAIPYGRALASLQTPPGRALDLLMNDIYSADGPEQGARSRYAAIFASVPDLEKNLAEGGRRKGFHVDFPADASFRARRRQLEEYKNLARYVVLAAEIEAEAGKVDRVFRLLTYAQRVLEKIGQHPYLIGPTAQLSGETFVLRAILRALWLHPRDERAVSLAEKLLKSYGDLPEVGKSLSTELVFARDFLGRVPSMSNDELRRYGIQPEMRNRMMYRIFQGKTYRLALEARLLRTYRVLWEELPKDKSRLDTTQLALRHADMKIMRDRAFTNSVFGNLLPVFSGLGRSLIDAQARRNIANATVAVLKARLKAGQLPESLPDAPYTKSVLKGKSLKYLRLANGGFRLGYVPATDPRGSALLARPPRGEITISMP